MRKKIEAGIKQRAAMEAYKGEKTILSRLSGLNNNDYKNRFNVGGTSLFCCQCIFGYFERS